MSAGQTAAPPRWASYEETGRLYDLSRWTLWRWAKAGHIRAAKFGGVVRLDCRSLEAFLEEQAKNFE